MKQRRVLVLLNASLLMSGVLKLLQGQTELSVDTAKGHEDDLHRRIRDMAPDFVVVNAKLVGEGREFSITRCLRENPRTTIIALSLDHPDIEVFRARQVRHATLDSLLKVMEGARRRSARKEASTQVDDFGQ